MAADELQNRHCFVTMFSRSYPHILVNIFFLLDYESYKMCMLVNSEWRQQLASERYKTWVRSVFRKEIMEDGKKLRTAVNYGKTGEVRRLLSSGMVDVNYIGDDVGVGPVPINEKRTPLNIAASGGHMDITRLLIENGADINMATSDGWTPLHSAAWKGIKDVVRFLLQSGADPKRLTDTGQTALHLAAMGGYCQVVNGRLLSGSKEVAKLLLEHEADPKAVNHQGETPYQLAISFGDKDVAQLLAEAM